MKIIINTTLLVFLIFLISCGKEGKLYIDESKIKKPRKNEKTIVKNENNENASKNADGKL